MSKRITADSVKLKRAYEPSASDDGTRILIDRLWPYEVKKVDAAIDEWIKDIAPSTALRKWFGHDPARWQEFRSRYAVEVHKHPEQLNRLRALAKQGLITCGFSAHDEVHNDAAALRDFLLARPALPAPSTSFRSAGSCCSSWRTGSWCSLLACGRIRTTCSPGWRATPGPGSRCSS
jgi:uncharacterized protein YeaO (DUF488 family)